MSKKATKKKIMEAFRKTISRWERIAEDPSHYDESYCHLCALENKEGDISQLCNESCPVKNYKGKSHPVCIDTPYHVFHRNRTKESALVELNFLREVYLDFLEDEIQEKVEELGKAIRVEIREKEECVDITKEIEWKLHTNSIYANSYWLRGYYKDKAIVWLDNDGISGFGLADIKVEKEDMSFTVFKRR